MTFRKTFFWLHLLAGLIAGLSIAIMCFTGTALAFEKELVAYAERDARRIAHSPAESSRLALAELLARVRTAHPTAKISGIALENHPLAAVAFIAGRNEAFYANPFTGEIRQVASTRTRDFLQLMEDWHRQLALGGSNRPLGKAINGAGNIAFFFLAVSGLYLWWPRKWRTKGLKRSLWFVLAANTKARDWNWHNVIGLWSAPVLIVLTLTALPISYRWAGNLIFTLTGTPSPPPTSAPAAPSAPLASLPAPMAQTQPLSAESLIARAQKELPTWTSLTYRAGNTGAAPTPATVALRTADAWPRTALTTLSLDPFTGEILKTNGYASLNAAQRVRSWTRFIHTGEALGALGQFVAALASLGGCVLVYTGFALAWHRWRRWRNPPPIGAS
ncbi:MAG: PepSY domain-containing protein [Opitutaceae bacterium]|nr:PepSY domain-containing protein [Opitutaceae bacterium]